MTLGLIIFIITILGMIFFIFFMPRITIKEKSFQTFYFAPLIGGILMLICKIAPLDVVVSEFTTNSAVNPLKILVLFFSLTFISIVIDETGFFEYLSNVCVNKFQKNQYSLFFILFLLISILTIFTSNDIVILTFTPLICLFSKKMKINPLPFLMMEFITANTMSILLPISNPTNIYLSTYYQINFLDYIKTMILPTLTAGVVEIILLMLLFHRDLKKPIEAEFESNCNINKFLAAVALSHLGVCIIALCISNIINIEMYLICLTCAISLTILVLFYRIKHKNHVLFFSLKRLPYPIIFFIISMFIIVISLDYTGFFEIIGNFFNNITLENRFLSGLVYGYFGLMSANILNNIPMTIAYSSVLKYANINTLNVSIYSTIAASNIGAYLTPEGALAGLMWINILHTKDVEFSIKKFIGYGFIFSNIIILFTVLVIALIA